MTSAAPVDNWPGKPCFMGGDEMEGAKPKLTAAQMKVLRSLDDKAPRHVAGNPHRTVRALLRLGLVTAKLFDAGNGYPAMTGYTLSPKGRALKDNTP
jgi:hypothetical protein